MKDIMRIWEKWRVRWVAYYKKDPGTHDAFHAGYLAGGANARRKIKENPGTANNSGLMQLLSDCKAAIWKAVASEDGLDGLEAEELIPRIDAVLAQQH